MLENIKSSYILRFVLSFIKEEMKLKLIKYNKSLQEKMEINLVNYKIFKPIYIIHEESGITKEYDIYCETLLFEGEYLNRKRNGKGKEYNKNEIIFDGEYYYEIGKKCNNHNLIYEGEYLNGEKNGKGKEFYDNDKFKYEGEYLYGEKNGKGKEYYLE